MLKKILKTLDGLDAAIATLYKKSGDEFVLDVDGDEDVAGLKAKNAELLAEKAKLKKEKDDAAALQQQAVDDAVEAAVAKAKKGGDVEALEASWQKKFDSKVVSMQEIIDNLTVNVSDLTSGSEATKLVDAIGIKGSMEVLLPHVQKRLRTDFVDGKPKVTVLGADGKPSAASLTELADEFRNNASFAPLIVGTKGNGRNTRNTTTHLNPGDEDTTALSPVARLTQARELQSQSK